MLVTLTAGLVSPEASWVRPLVFPTVPRLRAMLLADAPLLQLTPMLGMVVGVASEPSLLNVIATGFPVALVVPVVVLELDARAGSPKLALQALVPVLLQVIWIEFAVPSES